MVSELIGGGFFGPADEPAIGRRSAKLGTFGLFLPIFDDKCL
jgi:hypothetical protein